MWSAASAPSPSRLGVSLVAAASSCIPYCAAHCVWVALSCIALALALLWSSRECGFLGWVTAAAALAPWWVLSAVHVGQVVPLVAAGVVRASRLMRDLHNAL